MEALTLVQGETGFELPFAAGNWVLKREVGYSPVESLAAAVGACGGYVYTSILEKSKIPVVFKKIEVAYTRDSENKAEPLKTISIRFFVEMAEEYQGRAERSLKLVSQYCPVMQSLDPAITVTESVVFE